VARNRDLIEGYAQALLAVAEAEGAVESVEEELFQFARTLDKQGELRDLLTDVAVPVEQKLSVIEELLGEKASPHTLSLLTFMVAAGRARDLRSIVDRLAEMSAERRQRAVAEVRTAVPLTKEREQKLQTALSKATGKKVEVRAVVDPDVIGGVVARVGDQVFDGTIRRRLELARAHLSQA
jgi:F-type H+-transporting ATPase subunit delta